MVLVHEMEHVAEGVDPAPTLPPGLGAGTALAAVTTTGYFGFLAVRR
jgi:hypothetical protein